MMTALAAMRGIVTMASGKFRRWRSSRSWTIPALVFVGLESDVDVQVNFSIVMESESFQSYEALDLGSGVID